LFHPTWYFKVLQHLASSDADELQIRKAFREKSKIFHPDKSQEEDTTEYYR